MSPADPPERTLAVLRHAKSSWSSPTRADFDRPLAPRGEADAPRIGAWLAEHVPPPDWTVCSPARRAEETARLVLEAAGLGGRELHLDERIYEASAGALLDVLAECPPDARSALVVGHYPGLPELVELLTDAPIVPEEGQKPFPTGGLAVLAVSAPWDALERGVARLVAFARPRLLR